MWDRLPLDLLAHIFSFLPPLSLARAMAVCGHWHACVLSDPSGGRRGRAASCPWFLAMHARPVAAKPPCYVYSLELRRWHALPLDFLPFPVRLVASVANAGLLLCRLAAGSRFRLLLCNPFTRQHKLLPDLIVPRSNPAVGVVPGDAPGGAASFQIYAAGGATGGGYEPTLEVYESRAGVWRRAGATPAGFAVRLTVWTPNESVVAGGVVYWMTSARAYSVMGLEVATGAWREVKVPLADRLEWAALVGRRSGRLGLVGGCGQGEGWVWELTEGEQSWVVVGVVPEEVEGRKWAGGAATRCVGGDREVYLYGGELGKGMVVGREVGDSSSSGHEEERWEWKWIEEYCCSAIPGREKAVAVGGGGGAPFKGVLFHPSLSPSCLR
ncbi:hypothetical protein Taro_029062 [Colocasia esculenta]|uniref:F-box domain-containing protein n=1 Tax=Colocasia esculenta TaxID=4460 RepID=A0A843VMX2_COLES|nr:hypothetical protein [Colocasia esculenta]